jgi:carbamate kinase
MSQAAFADCSVNTLSGAVPPLVIVALGGNAITTAGTEGNIDQQFEQTRQTAIALADTIERSYRLVITHGNGPQVGNILRRVEIASSELYPIPLEVCVADTQAGMGYMIGQCLINELLKRGREIRATTVVTSVLIDADDPAFRTPTKAIGHRMSRSVAELHVQRDGWQICESEPGQFRRVVPSPRPRQILEFETIAGLVNQGELVICCGGGGIPVLLNNGAYRGAPAVIDKDYTSCMLGTQLNATHLAILTDEEHVYLDYGKTTQRALQRLTVTEARSLIQQGHFPASSMLPKIEAAAEFVHSSAQPGAVSVITRTDMLLKGLQGKIGTRIVAE